MDMLKSLTRRLVTSVKFAKAPYSPTLIRLHGCCLLFYVVRMKQMMQIGDSLYSVSNNPSIIVFPQEKVSMKVNERMEVAL